MLRPRCGNTHAPPQSPASVPRLSVPPQCPASDAWHDVDEDTQCAPPGPFCTLWASVTHPALSLTVKQLRGSASMQSSNVPAGASSANVPSGREDMDATTVAAPPSPPPASAIPPSVNARRLTGTCRPDVQPSGCRMILTVPVTPVPGTKGGASLRRGTQPASSSPCPCNPASPRLLHPSHNVVARHVQRSLMCMDGHPTNAPRVDQQMSSRLGPRPKRHTAHAMTPPSPRAFQRSHS